MGSNPAAPTSFLTLKSGISENADSHFAGRCVFGLDIRAEFRIDGASRLTHRGLTVWLFALAVVVAGTLVIGGLTRLTDSGLSITEWQPVAGVVPPLHAEAWEDAFAKYRGTTEYRQINRGMSLAEFKVIYWWEWAHRMAGRLAGLVFAVPFLFFWWRRAIPRESMPALLTLFALGAAQGALGWYMVQSGLDGRVDVSVYRLTAHFGLALLIFVLALRQGFGFWHGRSGMTWVVPAVFAQSLLGAIVAGLDAGMIYNDWPLIDGALIPSGLTANLFEDRLSAQFAHRLGGYLLLLALIWHAWRTPHARRSALWLAATAGGQGVLGIATLMQGVPLALGAAHQLGAVALLTLAVWHSAKVVDFRRASP